MKKRLFIIILVTVITMVGYVLCSTKVNNGDLFFWTSMLFVNTLASSIVTDILCADGIDDITIPLVIIAWILPVALLLIPIAQ